MTRPTSEHVQKIREALDDLREQIGNYKRVDACAKEAIAALSALERQLTPSQGWQDTPTEAMCDNARGFIMGLDLGFRNWSAMQAHLDNGGYTSLDYIRSNAMLDPAGHITKWDVADCIWQLMALKAKSPAPGEPAADTTDTGCDDDHDPRFQHIRDAVDNGETNIVEKLIDPSKAS